MTNEPASRTLRWSFHAHPRFWLAAFGIAVASALPCHAALWQSDNWALTGIALGQFGYDSNLTENKDGPSDFYASLKPSLFFLRRNSSTSFKTSLDVAHTEFLGNKEPSQTDVGLGLAYAYPMPMPWSIPVYTMDAGWKQSTQPNQYVGSRVKVLEQRADAEGYIPLTGKVGLRGKAEYNYSDYKSSSLNRNRLAKGTLGLGYKYTERLDLSLNAGYGWGRSLPNDPTRTASDVTSDEYFVTARVLGEITAKLTGSAYFGYGFVDYRGGYSNSQNLPLAGADLTWGIDPRRTLVLAAYSGAMYSPDGLAVKVTRTFLSFTHVIIDRWQYSIRGGPTFSSLGRQVHERSDTTWEFGLEFAYKPSDVFNTSIALWQSTQRSSIDAYEYDRSIISLGSSYRF
jgi:hypothetical protein